MKIFSQMWVLKKILRHIHFSIYLVSVFKSLLIFYNYIYKLTRRSYGLLPGSYPSLVKPTIIRSIKKNTEKKIEEFLYNTWRKGITNYL